MLDKTNNIALEKIKQEYKDQIEKFEYKVWKEPYLAKPPKTAFCSGITRYRKCFRVTHVRLKDGRLIPVESNTDIVNNIWLYIIIGFVFIIFFVVIGNIN